MIPLDEVTSGETFENPGTAPDPCPEGSPCSEGLRVTGFKFDDLGSEQPEGLGFLEAGSSQLFAFVFNQPPVVDEEVCAALKFGPLEACGVICGPACIICPDACVCPEEDIDTFDCTATVPENSTCFTIPEDVPTEDVLFGFCIVDQGVTAPMEPCQAPAEVFVCG